MAAPSTQTDTTSVTELIPTEELPSFVDEYGYTPRTGILVASLSPGLGSVAHRFARWDVIAVPAGTKSEGDDFTQVEVTTAEESITPGIVGFEVALTDEVLAAAMGGLRVPAGQIPVAFALECIAALSDRMDADILSSSTSATNTAGATTDTFTREKFSAAAAAYRALQIPNSEMMEHAFVGHHDAFRDLDADEVVTTAARAATSEFRVLGAKSGYIGPYGGFQLFESGNVAAEGAGWSNLMTPMGFGRSGLGLVVSDPIRAEVNRGRDGALSASTYAVLRGWWGAGMRNRTRLLEVLSKT